jgi:hypothetical protein
LPAFAQRLSCSATIWMRSSVNQDEN